MTPSSSIPNRLEVIRGLIKKTFELANNDGLHSLALTPIGTGAAGIPIETFAEALAEDTVDYIYIKSRSLREVYVVCNNKE